MMDPTEADTKLACSKGGGGGGGGWCDQHE